jgi:signal transduction histidine kinase
MLSVRNKLSVFAFLVLIAVLATGPVPVSAQGLSSFRESAYPVADTQRIHQMIAVGDSLLNHAPERAVALLQEAEQESLKSGYYDGATVARIKLGLAAIGTGDFQQSLLHYGTAYRYVQQARGYRTLLPLIFVDVGTIFTHMRSYDQAARHYLLVLDFMEKYTPEHTNRIIAYGNLAAVLINLGQYDRADYYLQQAEALARRKQDFYYLAYTLANRAGAALGNKDNDGAMRLYHEALLYAHKVGNTEIEQGVLTAMGQVMLADGKPDSAIVYTRRALEVPVPAYSHYSTCVPYYTLGIALYQTGAYREAETAIRTGFARARKTDLAEERLEALHVLSAICERDGRYPQALEYARHYNALKDSLLNKEKLDAVNRLEIKYRTARKDKELAEKQLLILSQAQKLERKNIWIGSSIAGGAVLGILLFFYYRNTRHRQRLVALEAMIAGEEKERSRIAQELHDGIGGMLAAVQMRLSGVADSEVDEIRDMVRETAAEVRRTSHNLMPDIIRRYDLVAALRIYCEKVNRSNGGLRLEVHVFDPVPLPDKSKQLSLYRILQEVIQNIVKHAEARHAIIQISYQQNMLNILVEDDGKGFSPEEVGDGLGINNIRLRVQMLEGTVSIESAPGAGTIVNISVPA